MSIINGNSSPIVKIFYPESSEESVELIHLPLANSKGLVETCEIKKLSCELISTNISNPEITYMQKVFGYIITFTINYQQYITGNTLYNSIKKILDASKAGCKLVLIPRKDVPWREFEVFLANDNFELALNKGGIYSNSHKLPVLIFKTVNLEPNLKWYPPVYNELPGGSGLPFEGAN